MALPNTPAPLIEAAATSPLESALDAVLGVLPDIIQRVESLEKSGVANLPNDAAQGTAIAEDIQALYRRITHLENNASAGASAPSQHGPGVLEDIQTLFGHFGLGTPKSGGG